MSDVDIAPSAGAAPSAIESGPPPSLEPSAGDYLSQIQSATSGPGDFDAPDATDPIGDVPAEEPAVQAAKPEGTPKAAPETAEAAAESIRQLLKRANFDPGRKEELADAYYKAKFYAEKGYTPDVIRHLDSAGVTPDGIVERLNVHPTVADARRDSSLASDMRSLAEDFNSNPEGMIQKLQASNPEAFGRLASAFATNLNKYSPEAETSFVSQKAWGLLEATEAHAKTSGNADLMAAVEILKADWFPNAGDPAQAGKQTGSQFNPQDPIHQKYQQLQEQQKQFDTRQATAFETGLREQGYKALLTEVAARVKQSTPTSMPDEYRERMSKDIVEGAVRDVFANPNLVADLRAFLAGPKTQDQMAKAITYLSERAKPFIANHHRRASEFWGKPFAAASAAKQVVQKQAAARPDVGRVGTAPSGVPTADLMSEAKSKGWDIAETVRQNWARQRR